MIPEEASAVKILIAGGSGFIGKALAAQLMEKKHEVVILSRRCGSRRESCVNWGSLDELFLSNLDGVINLAGENIASGRWTISKKAAIAASRVETTQTMVRLMRRAHDEYGRQPKWLINASAIGYYGADLEKTFDESDSYSRDFLAEVCRKWEGVAREAEEVGVRVVILRFGHILASDGGFLARMEQPFRYHVGGYIGSGRQWVSWIHRDDLVAMVLTALENESWHGVYNACAPEPVRMAEMSEMIGLALGRKSWTRLPEWILSLVFGELAEDVLLKGQRVLPVRAQKNGFSFRFPKLSDALAFIYKNK